MNKKEHVILLNNKNLQKNELNEIKIYISQC
jgi:hypothetical protein